MVLVTTPTIRVWSALGKWGAEVDHLCITGETFESKAENYKQNDKN
jgi:hypothetical protein